MNEDLRMKLQAPLDRTHTRTRRQGNIELTYVEGWYVLAQANELFGFLDWSRRMTEPHMIQCDQRDDKKWVVGYTAQCSVDVELETGCCSRTGTGFGQGIDNDLGRAHESAIKEAETDAFKRAMVTFGNQFGLELYDKDALSRQAPAPASPAPGASNPPAAPQTGSETPKTGTSEKSAYGFQPTKWPSAGTYNEGQTDKQITMVQTQLAKWNLTAKEAEALKTDVAKKLGILWPSRHTKGATMLFIDFLLNAGELAVGTAVQNAKDACAPQGVIAQDPEFDPFATEDL